MIRSNDRIATVIVSFPSFRDCEKIYFVRRISIPDSSTIKKVLQSHLLWLLPPFIFWQKNIFLVETFIYSQQSYLSLYFHHAVI